jgi:hypothetical protein
MRPLSCPSFGIFEYAASSFQLRRFHCDVYWVPTMGYFFYEVDRSKSAAVHKYMDEVLQRARQNVPIARELGVKIANGFDATGAEEQGKNARDIIDE